MGLIGILFLKERHGKIETIVSVQIYHRNFSIDNFAYWTLVADFLASTLLHIFWITDIAAKLAVDSQKVIKSSHPVQSLPQHTRKRFNTMSSVKVQSIKIKIKTAPRKVPYPTMELLHLGPVYPPQLYLKYYVISEHFHCFQNWRR